MTRDSYGVTRRRTTAAPHVSGNLPYDPQLQVPVEEMRAAKAVLGRMLDGGELLPAYQGPWLSQAIIVLNESINAADKRAGRRGEQ